MEVVTFSDMSNSEIRVKMEEYKNEYEVIKSQIAKLVEKMNQLDINYVNATNELKKRRAI